LTGVYTRTSPTARPVFHRLPPPTDADIAALVLRVQRRVQRLLIRKSLGLTLPLVQDFDQRIARDYGVRCWPTTVTLDPEGRVEHVQFGVDPGHGPRPGPTGSPAATRG
jgi:hypothetical protein